VKYGLEWTDKKKKMVLADAVLHFYTGMSWTDEDAKNMSILHNMHNKKQTNKKTNHENIISMDNVYTDITETNDLFQFS